MGALCLKLVLVRRVRDDEPAPWVVVRCGFCRAPCHLDRPLAGSSGAVVPLCGDCYAREDLVELVRRLRIDIDGATPPATSGATPPATPGATDPGTD